MTRITALVLVSTLVFAGACKKKEAETAPASGGGNVLKGATVPDDANARAFATNVLTHKAIDIRPMDSGEMAFVYKSLSFTAENNGWMAEAVVGQGQDSFTCQEFGAWEIVTAESAESGTMNWTVNKTTCAGREAGKSIRVKVGLKDGNYDVSFR